MNSTLGAVAGMFLFAGALGVSVGSSLLGQTGPTLQLPDGGSVVPPNFKPDASIQYFVQGVHANVAQYCENATSSVCDFFDTNLTRHTLYANTGNGVTTTLDGGSPSDIVQLPDGGWGDQ